MPPKKAVKAAVAPSKKLQPTAANTRTKRALSTKATVNGDASPPSKPVDYRKRKIDHELDEAPRPVKRSATARPTVAPKTTKTTTTKTATKTKTIAASKVNLEATAAKVIKAPTAKIPKGPKKGPIINTAPTDILELFTFGANSGGELGLGDTQSSASVKRPRANPFLTPEKIGVVSFGVGGMHTVALSHDNRIFTWGVNDHGALGRNTTWDGGLVEAGANDSDSDSDSEGGKVNPVEATPNVIDTSSIPEHTVFTQVVASDNASFALTDDGHVYGWGTFRGNDGVIGFSPHNRLQFKPMLLENLKNITSISCGGNHVLACDNKGSVFAWGSGQQNQLGRRLVERNKDNGLLPQKIGLLKKIKTIGTGVDHCFAVSENGVLYGWGMNNYGQTGVSNSTGEDNASTMHPTVIQHLEGFGTITQIQGGNHHTIALTDRKEVLSWGRIDGCATGHDPTTLADDRIVRDQREQPRILQQPTHIPKLQGVSIASGGEHSIAVTDSGEAYSWGFSDGYRTGLGHEEDVPTPKLIDNTAVRGKKLVWAGAGGQFSVLASKADIDRDTIMTNGIE